MATIKELVEALKECEEKIKKLESINEQMLTIILDQSNHIRYLEEMNKVKRI